MHRTSELSSLCLAHSFPVSFVSILFHRICLCLPLTYTFPVHPQVLIFEKILVEFCHSYGKLKTTNLINVCEILSNHNPFDRYLLPHNAPLDWTLGSLLLSYNCCCGWFSHRQIFHKVRLSTHTELMPKASLFLCQIHGRSLCSFGWNHLHQGVPVEAVQ